MKYPKFYVLYKDVNSGKIAKIDVLADVWSELLTKKGKLRKSARIYIYDDDCNAYPVKDRDDLMVWLYGHFVDRYWSRCEWEAIWCDWPNRDRVEDSRPCKVDVFDQISINKEVITDLVWNVLESRI